LRNPYPRHLVHAEHANQFRRLKTDQFVNGYVETTLAITTRFTLIGNCFRADHRTYPKTSTRIPSELKVSIEIADKTQLGSEASLPSKLGPPLPVLATTPFYPFGLRDHAKT
jgi:hypothetical protein